MKPINNLVLLKAVYDSPERAHGSLILGVGRAARDQYLKNYSRRHFEVIRTPEKLVFPKNRQEFFDSGYAFRYRTPMELKEGDTVWVKLRSGHGAKAVEVEGCKCYLVHYAECYVAQRRNLHRDLSKPNKNLLMKDDTFWDIIPLNGNVICEKVYKKSNALSIKDKEEVPGQLKVRYIGKNSPSYFTIENDRFVEKELVPVKLKHKDVIQCDGPYLNIEGEYFHDFNGETQPVAIHTTNIAGVL